MRFCRTKKNAHFIKGIYVFLILPFTLVACFGQDRNVSDSLVKLYESGNYDPLQQLDILNQIAQK